MHSGETVRSLAKGAKWEAAALRQGRWYNDACGLAFAMELVGERWSLLIVRELLLGPRRFNEMRAALPGLSAKVLSERLETLEGSGILTRCLLPRPLSARAYALTAWGQSLEPVLQAMVRWVPSAPGRDPGLPLSPVSLMLALVSRLRVERIGDLELWIAFDIAEQRFAGRLRADGLGIHPGGEALRAPDLRFSARSALDLERTFFAGGPLDDPEAGLRFEGDRDAAMRFITLFAQCPK